MYPVKVPKVDLRLAYRKNLELALIVALVMAIALLRLIPDIQSKAIDSGIDAVEIQVADIPPTTQLHNLPPPPQRPSIPIPTEDEAIPEDLTIDETALIFDLEELPPPPPPKDDEYANYVFIPYDEPPLPIGGYGSILNALQYPEIARKAGIEATVVVAVLIDENGNSSKTQILKGAASTLGFNEAAQEALMKTKWKPARQREMTIKVWVSVPIHFRLRETNVPVS